MKKIYNGDIPFKDYERVEYQGRIIREAERRQLDYYDKRADGVTLKRNVAFIARIQVLTYSRGRSAANWDAVISEVDGCETTYANFLEGCKVNIFMVDMLDIILRNNLFNGKSVYLHLAFCKRGANYGICQLED